MPRHQAAPVPGATADGLDAGTPRERTGNGEPLDLLVLGGVGIDTIVRVESLALPAADSIAVPPLRDCVAHTGTGVALGAQALGWRAALVDFIGDDPQGERVLDRFRQAGLAFVHRLHESGTRRSINLVDRHGRRLSFYDTRHPVGLRMPQEVYLPLLRGARHVHFSIMDWARAAYDAAERSGVKTSTDLHDWDGANPHHADFAYRSHLVFLSASALAGRHVAVMREILQRGRAEAVIVMAGERGSYLIARGDRGARHFPCAAPPAVLVDSNGAGDAFVCGFLDGYFRGEPFAACMRLGAVAGAYACTCNGTHEAFIGRAQLTAGAECGR